MNNNDSQKISPVLPANVLLKDIAKYAPSKLCGLIGNALIVPLYTNILSVSQYGIYVISLAVLSFLCILFSDWIGYSGLRFFKKSEISDQVPNYLSVLIIILFSNLLVMFGCAYVFRHSFYSYFNIEPKIFLIILVLIIPVAIRAILFQLLRAQIKPGAFTISTIINQILTILLSVIFIKKLHLGAVSILFAMAISISIIDLLLIYQSNIIKYLKWQKPDLSIIKNIVFYGLPIAAASISVWSINQSNKFITGYYYGLENIGIVGVAYNLTFSLLMTLFSVIIIAAFPRIINLFEEKKEVKQVISKTSAYYILFALPIVLFMSIYSQDIITIFANESYHEAYKLIPYFAFGTFFFCLTDYTTIQYHLANKTYILTILKIISGFIGLGLNFYLIKTFGIVGAGMAVLISNFVYFILSIFVVIPELEWKIPWKRLFYIALSFIIPLGAWLIMSNSLIYPICQIIILCLLFYYSYYWLTKNKLQ